MAVCCQNLTLGALSSHSVLSMLVGTLFKKFGLFLNTHRIFKKYINMFLYSVTEVSVKRSFKGYENIKLILGVLQFKSFIIPYYISYHIMY